tara:strand:+ start:317 stop:658 length:342 start_codon:yes stop_codon:yes gene_type:complete
MPHHYYDEELKKGLSFKDAMKAGKDIKKPKKPKKSTKKSGKSTSDVLGMAASLASTIADASPTKWRGPVDAGTPVKANEKPPEGMNITVGDFDTGAMGDEDQEYQKKKKMYGL